MNNKRRGVAARFWSKVDRSSDSECWLWTASVNQFGYGKLGSGGKRGKTLAAHRVAWELMVGPIPADMTVDHLCFTPACVNPAHMEIVSLSVNLARRRPGLKTHCLRGHEYTPENTYRIPSTGKRNCRTCGKQRVRVAA